MLDVWAQTETKFMKVFEKILVKSINHLKAKFVKC